MIGISFYLQDPYAHKRLKEAGESGIRTAFTSLHIPEETGDLAKKAKELLSLACELGINVYADTSQSTPSKLGLESFQDLLKLGVKGIRLDDGFDHETTLSLAKHFKLALNASTMTKQELEDLLKLGISPKQLLAWHNFYPRRETGLDEAFFVNQNQFLRDAGVRVAAFVPGDGEKRGPLFEGLPTLENHRGAKPLNSGIDLKYMGVDDVYIGDPGVKQETLKALVAYDETQTLFLRIQSSYLREGRYQLRFDQARDVWRFLDTRQTERVDAHHTTERPVGSITMDNHRYGRYQGEIQLVRSPLPSDERVNVIGKIVEEDIPLLHYVKPGQTIQLYN
ncbi:MupG family TIM beta-alpha barrel fold protein [Priestia koreensis]|uniref:DUF871 domain-containing protein n=1 Tax=Priestia koreensis TaxID=284581 RepID=A0A0M0KWI1_9BACI|nr:MupG family TIM beta-alpha barrel fold protein [Priestia koreensis]KOO42952.1 hypothetical protein AMD01_17615 [Priestia koreensis]